MAVVSSWTEWAPLRHVIVGRTDERARTIGPEPAWEAKVRALRTTVPLLCRPRESLEERGRARSTKAREVAAGNRELDARAPSRPRDPAPARAGAACLDRFAALLEGHGVQAAHHVCPDVPGAPLACCTF